MELPARMSADWVDSLANDDLLVAESELRRTFFKIEGIEKKEHGTTYSLMKGSAELIDAWSRWSRVSTATRTRGLRRLRA